MSKRKQQTVRLPQEVYDMIRKEAETTGESINDVIVEAVRNTLSRRKAERVLERVDTLHEALKQKGIQEDSVPYIRRLREGDKGGGNE